MKIGIDIGGSHIAIATVNEKGEIIEKIEQEHLKKEENMSQYILNYMDTAIEKLRKNEKIEEIGIAAPGNPKGSKITNLVNLGINQIDFTKIAEKYHMTLKTINDAKAAALAEKEYGSLRKTTDSVFLCLGTGIGGAVFLNGTLLVANGNPGFEIGHMVIEKNGIGCHCGKKGCFETYCSMKRLKDKLETRLQEIAKEKNKKMEIESAIQLKKMVKQNLEDRKIQDTLNEYINNLIIGLSNVIDIFQPEVISLGGSFVYFKDMLYDKLIEEMEKRKYVFNKDSIPKICLAELGNDAGIVGATLL